MAILETFNKQPGETRAFDISFADYLARNNTAARPVDPVQVAVDTGLTLVASIWVEEGGYVKLDLSGGQRWRTDKVTAWLYTIGGERLEADIKVRVKDF